MVFVNGQKFACSTCIKGHRSTTCNHGERPLHEIKKKGRPSTQCPHCKELRKAKQVSVRCICGREEGAAAVANGLKRAKSLSHDGRLTIPAIGGEELLRSVSTQGQSSPQDSSSDAQSSTGGVSHCGCLDGMVCTCCRDRTGHVVVKPSKGSTHANSATFKNYPSNRQRSTASLDLGKTGMLLFPRDTSSPLPFIPHGQNNQVVQSPDSFGSQGKATGIYASGASPLFAQTLSPSSSSGCDHSPSTSSLGSHQSGQMQSHLCFDYASSSDYDSDHYNPTTSYSYLPETMASYPVSNASDDLEDMDMLANADPKTIMDGIMNGTTALNPMESASADEIRMLYSALSSFDTASPSAVPTPPSRSYSSPVPLANTSMPSSLPVASTLASKSGCCGSGNRSETAPSTMASTPSHSPPAGRSDMGDEEMASKMDGCGCAISPNMCCCGERCACPGCLAYPNNQNLLDPSLDIDFRSNAPAPAQSSGCCGSNKNGATLMNDIALSDNNNNDPTIINNINNSNNSGNNNNNNNGQALNNLQAEAFNLSTALNLVQAKSDFDTRQSVKQQFKGLSGLEEAKMQHPTLLGDNGVLICGCGCGRPTVDCAECFRDMCQFVSESQGRTMKDDLDFESALNGDLGGNTSDIGLNMNMPVPLNMGMNVNMNMNMNLGMDLNMSMANFAQPSTMPQTMSLLSMQGQRSNGSPSASPSFEQQQQQYVQDSLQKQQLQQQQLALQMQQRLSLRRRFREGMEEEQKLQLQLMEQEQMQLQQLQQSMPGLDHLQLDFLDDEDWSFVDEIRTDASDAQMSPAPRP
ncbi:hypothetical protein BGZ95_001390 [Linnemannia exigua]|uniref:Copper-fist domain-containing protein n=1 Tax=Linnemannia exigua TaxID=604196 RepID=A0AAD4D6W9_9FUNG|nr:hypothetical protein BGZ95_001390 [Linnemannia exigua]